MWLISIYNNNIAYRLAYNFCGDLCSLFPHFLTLYFPWFPPAFAPRRAVRFWLQLTRDQGINFFPVTPIASTTTNSSICLTTLVSPRWTKLLRFRLISLPWHNYHSHRLKKCKYHQSNFIVYVTKYFKLLLVKWCLRKHKKSILRNYSVCFTLKKIYVLSLRAFNHEYPTPFWMYITMWTR